MDSRASSLGSGGCRGRRFLGISAASHVHDQKHARGDQQQERGPANHQPKHQLLGAALFLASRSIIVVVIIPPFAGLALGGFALLLRRRFFFLEFILLLGRLFDHESIFALGAIDLFADQVVIPDRDHCLAAGTLLFEADIRSHFCSPPRNDALWMSQETRADKQQCILITIRVEMQTKGGKANRGCSHA